MNSLSWFLYAADVLASARVVFFGIGAVFFIVGSFGWLAWTICRGGYADHHSWKNNTERLEQDRAWIETWNPLRKFLLLGFVMILLGCALPTSSTLYAIAASQVGEQIVKSEAVTGIADDATKALRQWIKRQIEPEKSK